MESDGTVKIYADADDNGTEAKLIPVDTAAEGFYYIEIPDIGSTDLDKIFKISVDGYRIEVSAMSYVYTVINNYKDDPEKEDLVNLCRALVEYSRTAEEYFNYLNSERT